MALELNSPASWRSELADNRRLRLGLLAVAALVVYFGFEAWSQHLDQLRAEVRQRAREVRRLQLLPPEQLWTQRADEAEAALTAQKKRIWVAPSAGAAQAALQEHLGAALRTVPTDRVSISVAEPEPIRDTKTEGLVRLRATVSFEAGLPDLWPALGSVLRSSPDVALDSVVFRRAPRPRIEAAVSAVALIEAPSSGGPASSTNGAR